MKINYWQHFEENSYYHIYNHAVSEQDIYIKEKDYLDFLKKHYKYLSCAFETIAYCLMPNHFHFVVKVKPIEDVIISAKNELSNTSLRFQLGETDINAFIIDQYRRFLSSYTLSYNFQHKRKGQLFLKRFKRVSLDQELKLNYMICYLHHNPIHHGFTNDFITWKYSSFKKYIEDPINERYYGYLTKNFGDHKSFKRYHQEFKLDKKDDLHLD